MEVFLFRVYYDTKVYLFDQVKAWIGDRVSRLLKTQRTRMGTDRGDWSA